MPTTADPAVRVLVLADCLPQDSPPGLLGAAVDAARGAHLRLVAPAVALPGERWIADRTARRTAARERLDAWTAVLHRHAARVEHEIGDERPEAAMADALAEFRAHAVVRVVGAPARVQPRSARSAFRITARSMTSWNSAPATGGR